MDAFAPICKPPFGPNPECRHHGEPTGWRQFLLGDALTQEPAPLVVMLGAKGRRSSEGAA